MKSARGVPVQTAVESSRQVSVRMASSFPRRRESRSVGTETYRENGFLRFCVLDSHFRGNDAVQVSVWIASSFPRRRESRSVGTETYRVKRFLEILRSGFPLSWE